MLLFIFNQRPRVNLDNFNEIKGNYRLMAGIFLLSIMVSCSSPVPEYFKQDEKWVPVLADMYAFQIAVESADATIRDSLERAYKSQIIAIHQLEQDDLDDFLLALGRYPDKAADMYEKVVTYLDEIEGEVEVQ